ncbi:hypothetical protein KC318_g9981 [Hortaea werneckii]|nr:hypothetical protein KC334_g10159 [Hortaea werneckii]KAI7001304.1 hypothetical protein KC355_g10077 [Hortaea werneckii]KAI7165525.1 hypothetical protein KC324_g12537 [Hortaea werneckii]KAI7545021.1 hypothetical protein KC316_g14935 [Hortaea werneckii]KAI7660593.1 hypothetical protein KC318_g9981 [Hortaea werneckii]
MPGSQFQGQPSQGIPNGSFPPNAPQGFRSFQGSPSAFDESQSSNDSQSMTQPSSQQQMPPYQQNPYQAPPTDPAAFQGRPSQSYHSGSVPQVPQQQMQGAGSPPPQQQWPYQGHPGQNPAPVPQQNMQPTLHQAGPSSELTSSTSEESSDSDSSSSDDDENYDDEGEDNEEVTDGDKEEGGEDEEDDEDGESDPATAASHPGWPQQAHAPAMPPQQPRAASLASSLSGASRSTTNQPQPVEPTHPKAPSSVNSTLSGATGSTKHTANRSVRQKALSRASSTVATTLSGATSKPPQASQGKVPSRASSTVATTLSGATSKPPQASQGKVPSRASSTAPTTLSGATSKPPWASQHAKESQRQYMPTIGERQVLAEDERSIPKQEHSLSSAPARPASLTSTRHRGTRHSSREHPYAPGSVTNHSNHGVHQPQYPPSLRTMPSSKNKGSQTSRRTSQMLGNQPKTEEYPPSLNPQEAERGEANAYYDPNQTFSSRYSAPSTKTSFRPNANIPYQNPPGPANPHSIPSSPAPAPPPPALPPPPPPHGNQPLPSPSHQPTPSHPDNPPPNATITPNPVANPDPFAHSIPPGWKATLKGFARLYLNQHLHHDPSRSTGAPPTKSAATATAMRAEKYELFLRGERFFRHPVIRICGNFRRRHYAVIAERVEEVRRAVVEGSDPGYGRAGGEPARAVAGAFREEKEEEEGRRNRV